MAFEKSFLISIKNIDFKTSFHICKSVNSVIILLSSFLNSSKTKHIIIRSGSPNDQDLTNGEPDKEGVQSMDP